MRYERLVAGLFVSSSALFLLSGLGSVWASVERPQAWARYVLLVLGVAIAFVAWRAGVHDVDAAGKGGFVAALVAAAVAAASVSSHFASSEAVAGSLVALIALGAGGIFWSLHANRRMPLVVAPVALGVAGVGLALTGERGAWLGLAVGVLTAVGFAWRYGSGRTSRFRFAADVAATATVLAVVVGAVLLVSDPAMLNTIARAMGDNDYGRVRVWQDGLQLAEDYVYSGIGFGQTGMVLSTYVYLFHVPFLFQTYNLFLQIALEQGLAGLIGFLGILVAGVWRVFEALRVDREATRRYAACTLAAITGLCVHGLFDAGAYVSLLSPILLVPAGFAMGLTRQDVGAIEVGNGKNWGAEGTFAVGAVVPWVLAIVLVLLTGAQSTWLANRASVEQTRLELAAYDWPEWYVQDDVRRTGAVALEDVVTGYADALTRDPDNVTAHRRLGQIAVSMGDLTSAREHLEAAYALAPMQRTTRQLLGEVYAVSGNVDQAVEVWTSGVTDPHKLELRLAWYRQLGKRQQAEWLGEAVGRLGTQRGQAR